MQPLSIYTFGGLSVRQEDAVQSMRFETRTMEALLVYLACHSRPLGREPLAELLWPERSHQQALTNLRVAIHRLRQQLAPYLRVTRQSIALAPHAVIELDSMEFEGHLGAGRFVEAVSLYSGDFLDGFYIDGSPVFEQWMLLERERLRNLAISAYQQLVIQLSANGQIHSAIRHAERLLQLDPLHEPTHRQLMRLLASSGQRTAALAQYAICRQLLDRELNVPPDEVTTTLYEQIRSGTSEKPLRDSTGSAHAAGATEYPLLSRQHLLPPQPTTFLGRETELAQIATLLANPDCRLLTLLGVGGIGKTRLSLEAATRHAGHFADGIYFVSLASVDMVSVVPATIAQSLGIQPGSGDLLAQISEYLYPRQILLVLDNFEHLLEAATMVENLIHSAPHVKILVTSRERLYLLEEWLLLIGGLSVAEGLKDEARQLFVRSAQRVQPAFTPEGHEEAIAAICRQVEGMPLALELAASWVRVMSCAEIAQQITRNLDLLTTSLRNLPERHRSLRSLYDQSWRLLNQSEQAVLMRLSVFWGGWALEQAAEVAGATLPILLSLVEKSLVRPAEHSRFDLHELVRQYVAEQLALNNAADLTRQSHYGAYLRLARATDGHLRGPGAVVWYKRLEVEHDNLRAAMQWALNLERYEDAAWLGVALHHFWYTRGHWYEGARWLEQLLPHRHVLTVDLRLAMLLTLYRFWRGLEDFLSIDHYMYEIMQMVENSPYPSLRAAARLRIATSTPDASQAIIIWEQCIDLARASVASPQLPAAFCEFADTVNLLAEALFRYAIRLIDVGEYERAAQLSAESIKLLQAQGDRGLIAFGFGNLGRVALLQGDVERARAFFHEAVMVAAAVDNRLGLSEWQPRLAIVMLYAGDVMEARRLLTETLDICAGLRGNLLYARVYTYLAETALWERKLDEAEQWIAQSLLYHANPRWVRIELVECLWVAARLAAVQQQYQRAANLFGLAEQLGSQIRCAPVEPIRTQITMVMATVQQELGTEHFAEAIAAGRQLSIGEAFATILASGHITNVHAS